MKDRGHSAIYVISPVQVNSSSMSLKSHVFNHDSVEFTLEASRPTTKDVSCNDGRRRTLVGWNRVKLWKACGYSISVVMHVSDSFDVI